MSNELIPVPIDKRDAYRIIWEHIHTFPAMFNQEIAGGNTVLCKNLHTERGIRFGVSTSGNELRLAVEFNKLYSQRMSDSWLFIAVVSNWKSQVLDFSITKQYIMTSFKTARDLKEILTILTPCLWAWLDIYQYGFGAHPKCDNCPNQLSCLALKR